MSEVLLHANRRALRYSRMLEEGSFRGRQPDFAWMLIFGATLMTVSTRPGCPRYRTRRGTRSDSWSAGGRSYTSIDHRTVRERSLPWSFANFYACIRLGSKITFCKCSLCAGVSSCYSDGVKVSFTIFLCGLVKLLTYPFWVNAMYCAIMPLSKPKNLAQCPLKTGRHEHARNFQLPR